MKNILLFTLILCSLGLQAQDHTIKGKIAGLNPNDTVKLGQYLGKSLFYNDTAVVANDGYFTFKGKPYEEGGKYAIIIEGPKILEILMDDHDLVFESDADNLDMNMNVIKSDNNKKFYAYKKYLGEKNKARSPFDLVIADTLSTEKQLEKARKGVTDLTKDVIAFQKKTIEENKDKLIGKLINMSMEVEVPTAPETAEDERTWRYRYYRDHYWDNVDLTDPRLVREQAFHRVLEKYLTTVLPQIPDTVLAEGSKLADQVEGNYDMFKYVVHQLTYLTETSKVMCMDKAFVGVVNRFYKTGKADWLTDEKLQTIIEGADKKANTLCGEIAPNIILPDTSGENWVNMHQLDAEYLVLAIWEPGCGHCKKEMPKLKEIFDTYKGNGLQVLGVNNELENEDWLKFLEEKELDWINISDNPSINAADSARTLILNGTTTLNSLNFRSMYDVTSTPKIYLLNRDKEIIAKQLSSEQLGDMLMNLTKEDSDKEKQSSDELDEGFINENNKTEKKKKRMK